MKRVSKQQTTRLAKFLILIFLSSGCSVRQGIPVGQIPVPQQPTATDRQSTMAMVKDYADSSGYSVIKGGAEQARVQKMVDRMTKAAGAVGYTFPVVFVDAGDEVNAAAVNGATIVVHSSLLRKVSDDDELATVIGHEVAHIAAKHHEDDGEQKRAQAVGIGSALVGVAATVGAAVAGIDPSTADMAGDIGSGVVEVVGTGALVKGYSRDMEREADHVGLMIMAKAGYNPEAALRFWARASEIFGVADGMTDFLSTHPASDDRLERLQAALPIAKDYYRQAMSGSGSSEKQAGKAKKKSK